jgi:hypothetical protein
MTEEMLATQSIRHRAPAHPGMSAAMRVTVMARASGPHAGRVYFNWGWRRHAAGGAQVHQPMTEEMLATQSIDIARQLIPG